MSEPDAIVVRRPLTWRDVPKFWPTYADLARESFTWGDLANATIEVMVRTAADAVPSGAVTAADVRVIVGHVVRSRFALAQPAATRTRRDWRGDLTVTVAALSLVVAWLTYRHTVEHDAQPETPPAVTVVVPQPDPAELDRHVDARVDERLREHETGHEPGTASQHERNRGQ